MLIWLAHAFRTIVISDLNNGVHSDFEIQRWEYQMHMTFFFFWRYFAFSKYLICCGLSIQKEICNLNKLYQHYRGLSSFFLYEQIALLISPGSPTYSFIYFVQIAVITRWLNSVLVLH